MVIDRSVLFARDLYATYLSKPPFLSVTSCIIVTGAFTERKRALKSVLSRLEILVQSGSTGNAVQFDNGVKYL